MEDLRPWSEAQLSRAAVIVHTHQLLEVLEAALRATRQCRQTLQTRMGKLEPLILRQSMLQLKHRSGA